VILTKAKSTPQITETAKDVISVLTGRNLRVMSIEVIGKKINAMVKKVNASFIMTSSTLETGNEINVMDMVISSTSITKRGTLENGSMT